MITVEKLSYEYPNGEKAIQKVSLEISKGETIIIAGPNGSGKTTLAKLLTGLETPTNGTVKIKDKNIAKDESHARKNTGIIFQNPDNQLLKDTVKNEIRFGPENLELSEKEIEKRSKNAMETMQITDLENKSPHQLSEGQKKRVAIASVLAMKPEILIIDSPLHGLDHPSTRSLIDRLKKLQKKDYTIVMMTDWIHDLWRITDRIHVLNDGEIVKRGEPTDLFKTNLKQYGISKPSDWKLIDLLEGEIENQKKELK